jgi:hypothetical protein
MGKLARTLDLMSASWQVLLNDREILVLPILSGICSTSVLVSFVLLGLHGDWLQAMAGKGGTQDQAIVGYVFLFCFYVVNYFIIYFFNAAIVACAAIRLEGGNPTLNDGLSVAIERVGAIAAWSLVAGTVGFILGSMESRSRGGRSLVAGLLGIAWSVLTFLAVPLMVVEKCPAGAIIPRSRELVGNTWGEQVMGNVGFGTIFFILTLPVLPVFFLLRLKGGDAVPMAAVIGGAVYLVLLSIVQSALRTIFTTVLYLYAARGKAPTGFADQQLRDALRAP